MASPFGSGWRVGNNDPIDDRQVHDTVEEVIRSDSPKRISNARRFDGLTVWIRALKQWYVFDGGITDDHFVPVPMGGGTDALSATQGRCRTIWSQVPYKPVLATTDRRRKRSKTRFTEIRP